MKKIFITGAGGFLGFEIAKLVVETYGKEFNIYNISRHHHTKLDELGIETIRCDISRQDQVEQLDFSETQVIFHVAAIAGVWGRHEDFYRVNYEGTKFLVQRAKKHKVEYFIYTSSPSVVFGKEDILMGDEKIPYPEKYYTAYAHTKALAEKFIFNEINEEFKALSIRPHLIWGPGDPHLIPRIIQKARTGKLKRVGAGVNLVDVIYVKNAALAHLQAYQSLMKNSDLSGNSYFIGQERPVNLWDFIDQILEKKNMLPLKNTVSFKLAYILGAVLEWVYKICGIYRPEPPMTRFVALQLAKSHYFSHDKAKNDFGYHPEITIEQGLEQTFKPQSESI